MVSEIKKPTKKEQRVAMESYHALDSALKQISSDNPEIEIEETGERIRIPIRALRFLSRILEATAHGKPVTVVPVESEFTTQAAADFLGCSRPYLIKLLQHGVIPYTKVGKHRRIRFEDLQNYKRAMKDTQRKLLIELMKQDEKFNMYDT